MRSKPGMPAKYRVTSPASQKNRSTLSILSPLNRTAVDLGKSAVVLFAGVDAKIERYASWPKASTCPLVPKGGHRPVERAFDISGNPTEDIANIATAVRKQMNGQAGAPMTWTSGEVKWLVEVGDEIKPLQPLLRVGNTTFLAQPKLRAPAENPPLYVANRLLTMGAILHRLREGEPLLVAVHDLDHLVRF